MKCDVLWLPFDLCDDNKKRRECSTTEKKRLTGAVKYFKFSNKTDVVFPHNIRVMLMIADERTAHVRPSAGVQPLAFVKWDVCQLGQKHHQNSLFTTVATTIKCEIMT